MIQGGIFEPQGRCVSGVLTTGEGWSEAACQRELLLEGLFSAQSSRPDVQHFAQVHLPSGHKIRLS